MKLPNLVALSALALPQAAIAWGSASAPSLPPHSS